jgi:hypothetical protein
MALRKTDKGIKGFGWCFFHCLIYATVVSLFLWTLNPVVFILVFLSHFPIDRWSLATHWLRLIKGRDFFKAYQAKENYWEIDLSFSCLVYAVADNTLHLILLWFIMMKVL